MTPAEFFELLPTVRATKTIGGIKYMYVRFEPKTGAPSHTVCGLEADGSIIVVHSSRSRSGLLTSHIMNKSVREMIEGA